VGGHARNVILLIGDGMGDSEITVARNDAEGAAGRLAGIDALPLTGQYTTYSLTRSTGLPDYVPASAATGSAWATGTKTYDNAVSVDLTGQPQRTLLELAQVNGLKTGDVTTSEIQDATPAVLVSHISARSCYGTEQLLNTRPDVTSGAMPPRLPKGEGRQVAGHDPRRAGGAARLPGRVGRRRTGRRVRSRPGRAAARAVRAGRHAGPLGRPGGHQRRVHAAGKGVHSQPEPPGHPPSLAARSARPSTSTRPSRSRWSTPRRHRGRQ
jgi:hypothetical protein